MCPPAVLSLLFILLLSCTRRMDGKEIVSSSNSVLSFKALASAECCCLLLDRKRFSCRIYSRRDSLARSPTFIQYKICLSARQASVCVHTRISKGFPLYPNSALMKTAQIVPPWPGVLERTLCDVGYGIDRKALSHAQASSTACAADRVK
jgi:hypothetical protein